MKPPCRITIRDAVFEELDRKTATAMYVVGGEIWYCSAYVTPTASTVWLLTTGRNFRTKYLNNNYRYFRIIYEN